MARHKDAEWELQVANVYGKVPTEVGQLAVLMDIRDELKQLNQVLHCPNFLEIPLILREIRRNTTKRRRTR